MPPIRLSIGIPTYNFGRFIGDTLASIIRQATEEVEIVVVDGASSDNTPEIVNHYQKQFEALRYYRLEKRGGIDLDMETTLSLCKGRYCWLFSADDIMIDGSIPVILNEINSDFEVYLCGLKICTFEMVPIKLHPILIPRENTTYNLSDRSDREKYFHGAATSTAFFSYMSSLVVNKTRIDPVPVEEEFLGSCWAHVVRIFRLLPSGLRVRFLPGPLLLNRSGNDSFLERGIVNRIGIAVDGYHRISDTIFGGESFEAFHMRRVIRKEYTLPYLLHAKMKAMENPNRESMEALNRLVDKLYCDGELDGEMRRFLFKVSPYLLLKGASRVSSAIRRMMG